MTMSTATLIPLCPVDEIPLGLGRSFRLGDAVIAVFRSRAGKVFAVENACPHRGGPLADGMMVGEQIVCPLHAFRYHGDSGQCDQANVCSLRTYPVQVTDGVIHLELTAD
jgi:nitrite reductase (NADH) small subunit